MSGNLHVDLHEAKTILCESFEKACSTDYSPIDKWDFIDKILNGTHLTFKYILFTELLAKSTNNEINPLCLQSGSNLSGSYDARSLCHKVIVPFEKEKLDKILGGSNEPFLNKPARFPDISPSNAVRAGRDKELLLCLYESLPTIDSSTKARSALEYFLYIAKQQIKKREENIASYITKAKASRLELSAFLHSLLRENNEGESLTLVVANVYNLLYEDDESISVEVHPVNQCGASSKEISDLDIKEDGIIFLANELKDKTFTETDIEHAVDKVIEAEGSQMYFIVGKNGAYSGNKKLSAIVEQYRKRGVMVSIVEIDDFLDSVYPLCRNASLEKVIEYSAGILKDKKFKAETAEYFYHTIDLLKLNEN